MAGIYYEKIDVEGHHFGPHSPEIQRAIRSLDQAFQTLNQKIKVFLHGWKKEQYLLSVLYLAI